ncbi:endonuclease/exonuclease/phosphatase family protein [Kitasatospora sp. SC0581]|uniref:endonuclease/exonuclease/phosphatase family protein n=1 Tax=Kitasatospora sp. SC0581 TaxID=3394360 RepID=UPI003A89F4B8
MDSRLDSAEATVDVLSFNIHHGEGTDGVLDLERIARVIRRSGAEIVGLQEVDRHFDGRSQWNDQVAELARSLGYHLAYGANIDLEPAAPAAPRCQYGTAVLSRHPITRARNTHLFRSPGEEQRGLLHVEIDLGGIPLQVFVTHLELFSEIDRIRQAEEVVELIGETGPAILLGDFNAASGTSEITRLRAAFTDSWTVLDGGPVATFPADAPRDCIDYVFAGRGVTPVRVGLVTEEPVASDHLPVLARLVVSG